MFRIGSSFVWLCWVRVIVLWVVLGTGHSLVGCVGHGFNIILSSDWIQVEMCGFGLGVVE